MNHKITNIAKEYTKVSNQRQDKIQFNEHEFIQFAILHKNKYDLFEIGNELYVNTFYFDKLITDYKLN